MPYKRSWREIPFKQYSSLIYSCEGERGGILYITKLNLLRAKPLTVISRFPFWSHAFVLLSKEGTQTLPTAFKDFYFEEDMGRWKTTWTLSDKGRIAIWAHLKERNNIKIKLSFDVFVNNFILLCIRIMTIF